MRTVKVSPSRAARDSSRRPRSTAAFAIERSMWISASYAASATACEITAARARALLRIIARSEASRSACADCSNAKALAPTELTRSSIVRTANLASTSEVRATET